MTELCTIVDGILPHPPFQGISYITNNIKKGKNKTKQKNPVHRWPFPSSLKKSLAEMCRMFLNSDISG